MAQAPQRQTHQKPRDVAMWKYDTALTGVCPSPGTATFKSRLTLESPGEPQVIAIPPLRASTQAKHVESPVLQRWESTASTPSGCQRINGSCCARGRAHSAKADGKPWLPCPEVAAANH